MNNCKEILFVNFFGPKCIITLFWYHLCLLVTLTSNIYHIDVESYFCLGGALHFAKQHASPPYKGGRAKVTG